MNPEAIRKIKNFNTLATFLSEELNWPIIDSDNVEDLVFEYTPEDIGLNEDYATKVNAIKQIRPLDQNQPWSVFWIDFENKKLPLTVLRRILNVFVTKKRGNSRNLATKELEDIMFVCGHGEDKNRAITFAHFKRLDDVETIREFYWDGHETKFDHISNYLEKLEWPENTKDVDAWRAKWKSAFTGSTREAIKTSDQLAKAMANIAKNIRDRVLEVLAVELEDGPVHKLFDTFRSGLVHGMTETGFADMYAQTITYGLFSARTMDTDGHFELHEVIDLIPSTNPFLKNLFAECLKTGDKKHKIDLDELGVGSLVDLFDSLNRSDGSDTMQRILEQFGSQNLSGQEDPVIHFYEGFLCEYDSKQRVEKGVYYTPDPVVSFIVRSVNEQLKSEFGLEMGLADTTTWAEMVASGRVEYPSDPNTGKTNKEWVEKIKMRAFVQILDPATGTGTFLKHTIEIIHEEVKAKHKKDRIQTAWLEFWNDYVYRSLLPRIYGFELMMASYSVAHMKIGMYLKSLGYKFEKEQRLNIFLSNSLEPYTANNQVDLFFTSVGAESAGANGVKQNRLFSVVIGNPPYSGVSKNNDPWIKNLINDYKYIEGEHFKERKHWLNADEIKFVRLGQHLIMNNSCGILAYINPHSFLNGPTFRGMRWHLLNNFNKINILDLHGNSNIKENDEDGSLDQNVFDIQQGVSINIFVKTVKKIKKEFATVFRLDLFGLRESKYDFLTKSSLTTINFKQLELASPFYVFQHFRDNEKNSLSKNFGINELFPIFNTGLMTSRDTLFIDHDKDKLKLRIEKVFNKDYDDQFIEKFNVRNSGGYKLMNYIAKNKFNFENITKITYRPLDTRWIYYSPGGITSRPAFEVMGHVFNKENILLLTARSNKSEIMSHFFISKYITEVKTSERTTGSIAIPLYIYPIISNEHYILGGDINVATITRIPNLNMEIINEIENILNLKFVPEKETKEKTFTPIDILDYIYAVLHSPTYREKHKEFLKINFPRIPYPKDKETFWQLVKLGGEIRQIHLLESAVLDNYITQYPIIGDNIVNKKANFEEGKVWINKTQYFDNVPHIAWEFYIGGYQPAQKWLKDRKGRCLSEEDVEHYQKIIVALTETDRIMKEIDKIEIE